MRILFSLLFSSALFSTNLPISVPSELLVQYPTSRNRKPDDTQKVAKKIDPYMIKNYDRLLGMPGFTNSALNLHFKLYQGYVNNTNDLLTKLDSMDSSSYEYGALKRRLGWEFDGMRLHELYFDHLGGNGQPDKFGPLFLAIVAQYGSFDAWKKDFIATGTIRGIGWAVLYLDPQDGRLVNVWINEHDTGHLATGSPIIIMDVFEHAYMPQFGLDKAAYISAFFTNLNWKVAETRYKP